MRFGSLEIQRLPPCPHSRVMIANYYAFSLRSSFRVRRAQVVRLSADFPLKRSITLHLKSGK